MHSAVRPAAWTALLLFTASAAAEDGWRGALGVRTVVNFTDNVLLSQVNPESDVVLQLQPFFNATWTSRVSSAQVAYAPQFAVYANHGDLNRNWQFLRADSTTELVEDFVFLVATARANPNVINDANATAGFDTVANPDAYTQTASFSIAPVFRFPFRAADFANVTFSPGLNLVFSGDTAGNSGTGGPSSSTAGTATNLTVESGSYFQRMPWSLNYTGDVFNVDDGAGFSRAWGQVGYRFNAKYRTDLLVGTDYQNVGDNDSATGRDLGNGLRWQPRLIWTPNQETSATIGIGQASYGPDYYLNVVRKQKRFVLSLQYESTIRNARQAVLTQEVVPFQDPFGDPVFDPINDGQINQVVNTPTLVDDTYVNDSLTAAIAFRGRRTTITFNAYVNWDSYQFSAVETVQTTGSLTLQHRLGAKVTGRAVVLYRDYRYEPDDALDYDQYRLEFGLNYRLGRKTSAGVAYNFSHSSTGSGDALGGSGSATAVQSGNYEENRVVLTFSTEI
jgi:uncharacterized protein (PEP-CTERM system associated)